jgi:hypothetical protein
MQHTMILTVLFSSFANQPFKYPTRKLTKEEHTGSKPAMAPSVAIKRTGAITSTIGATKAATTAAGLASLAAAQMARKKARAE